MLTATKKHILRDSKFVKHVKNKQKEKRLPIVEAIIDEARPKTQAKGNEIARARGPKSETWYTRKHLVRNTYIKLMNK